MNDVWIRRAMPASVVAVAVFAAVISYSHIYALSRANGGAGVAPWLMPLSVDGLIVAASLVMLHEARRGRPAPGLARAMLILGVAATIAANVAFGAAFGVFAAVMWAWPAVAFVGSAELMFILARRLGGQVTEVPPGLVPAVVPGSAEDAARLAYRRSLEGGNPLSRNQLETRFGITRTTARQICEGVPALGS